jgi:mannose-6-phosphate isomerase-like protein (cupin superfamily)
VADYTVKKIEEMPRSFGGGFVHARASLGVSAFGMQVFDLPPDWAGPEHAHRGMTGESAETANDGQEEVYFGLEGTSYLGIGEEEVALDKGTMVRVGPAQMRQLRTKGGPAQVLVVGAVPGGAYKAPGFTELPAEA